ncbi:MAG: glucoamylase family protein [Oryzihumus sp.]
MSNRTPTRRQLLAGGGAALAVAAFTGARPASAAVPFAGATTSGAPVTAAGDGGIPSATLLRWARDTWASMVAMTDPGTGLVSDNIDGALTSAGSRYTSPTNIGGYLWSAVVARELGIIGAAECHRRIAQTLATLGTLKRNAASGQFYNWYDVTDGSVLTTWPDDGSTVHPFLSSVDNGWLAAALMVVRSAEPTLAGKAQRLLHAMNFGSYYDKDARPGGLMRGGFWETEQPGSVRGNYLGVGPDVYYTGHHYDTTVSETRIASYIAIARGQAPRELYYATWRTFPDSCDWSWQEQKPVGEHRTYLGLDVFEGAYTYRGMRIVPGWGGSMFEALMPDMFVPEETWAPRSWGVNHPLTVRAHREFGLDDAQFGYWGFSPASRPGGGYDVYGVDLIGLNPDGYPADLQGTNVDIGFEGCREGTNPHPAFGDGVVTPHASFLAMMHEPAEAVANLTRIERDLGAYGRGGFFDAVAVRSGTIARRYLSLDQAMVLGSIGNVLADDVIRRHFVRGEVQDVIKPLIGLEEFGAGAAS